MRIFWHFTTLFLLLVSASSASSGGDVFAGCYSLDQDGEPWIKIEKPEETYYVSLRDNDGWKEGRGLHPGTQQELSEFFENDGTRIKASLVADKGRFALFHVQAGETYGGFKAGTDYITYIIIGAGSAYKKDCINSE
jgi:hypothetical protein